MAVNHRSPHLLFYPPDGPGGEKPLVDQLKDLIVDGVNTLSVGLNVRDS